MMENHISVRPRSPVLEAAGEWRQIVKAQLAIIHYYNRNLVMSTQLTLKLILQDSSNTCSKLTMQKPVENSNSFQIYLLNQTTCIYIVALGADKTGS